MRRRQRGRADFDRAGGVEARSGTRHFSPGTKVWVPPTQWGDGGEDLMVLGKHRGERGGPVWIVVPRRHLTNFRVQPTYSPAVMADLTRPWRETPNGSGARMRTSRAEADVSVAYWNPPPRR